MSRENPKTFAAKVFVEKAKRLYNIEPLVAHQMLEAFHVQTPYNHIHQNLGIPMEAIAALFAGPRPPIRFRKAQVKKKLLINSVPVPKSDEEQIAMMRSLRALRLKSEDIRLYMGITLKEFQRIKIALNKI